MNASPDSPRLDVLVDDFSIASNLQFRAVSGYSRVDDGFNDILVFDADSDNLLLEGTQFLARRQEYTLVVLNFLQVLDAILLTDDNSAPLLNDFKLRFVHASPTAGAVDLYITAPNADLTLATPSFSNVDFEGFAGYASQPQGSFEIRVTPTGTKNVISDTGALTFIAGQIRTAVLVNPPGTATEPLGIVLLQDRQ